MDVSDKASYYIEKKVIKVAKWGTPKKNKKFKVYFRGTQPGGRERYQSSGRLGKILSGWGLN